MTIVVAGYTGLVGSALFDILKEKGDNVIGINSNTVDLLNRSATMDFLKDIKPKVVIDAAAKVGGIGATTRYPVDFLQDNLKIQSNLMEASHNANVERFIFVGSSCVYPRNCKQPMSEEDLMSGQLEVTNSAYSIAKISGIELVKAYRKQFSRSWISVMPPNVYGPRDNFHLETGRVVAALINRFVTAVEAGKPSVQLWGSGEPRREFIHSRDLASGIVFLLNEYDSDLHINVGSGSDIDINSLAQLIAEKANFRGTIEWDRTRPDGTPRKLLDISRIRSMGWEPRIGLDEGITETLNWFLENRDRAKN